MQIRHRPICLWAQIRASNDWNSRPARSRVETKSETEWPTNGTRIAAGEWTSPTVHSVIRFTRHSPSPPGSSEWPFLTSAIRRTARSTGRPRAFLRAIGFSTMISPGAARCLRDPRGSQQSGVDIPLLSVVGDDAGGFLVGPDDDAPDLPLAGRDLKAHPVANAETSQHGRCRRAWAMSLSRSTIRRFRKRRSSSFTGPDRLHRRRPVLPVTTSYPP